MVGLLVDVPREDPRPPSPWTTFAPTLGVRPVNAICETLLRNLPLTSEVRKGERLPREPERVERVGLERVIVREALRRLEAVRIVLSSPRLGWFVLGFSFDATVRSRTSCLESYDRTLPDFLEVHPRA